MRSFVFALLLTFCTNAPAQDVKTYIPTNAYKLLPVVKSEVQRLMPEIPSEPYMAALIEQESCISLRHSRCWSATAQLKTEREHGVGLFQLTRVWYRNGSLRFDTLTDLSRKYRSELNGLNWNTVTQRPDLQIRAGILLVRDNYNLLSEVDYPMERLKMSVNAFNGGLRDLKQARRICGLSSGCNPDIYFDHVENHSVKSRNNLTGLSKSAWQINREHSRNIYFLRLPKYEKIWPTIPVM